MILYAMKFYQNIKPIKKMIELRFFKGSDIYKSISFNSELALFVADKNDLLIYVNGLKKIELHCETCALARGLCRVLSMENGRFYNINTNSKNQVKSYA